MYQHGRKPLKKLIDPGGETYYNVAFNKLQALHRNAGSTLVDTMSVDGFDIRVEKHHSFDRIQISGGSGPWVTLGYNIFFRTSAPRTQFAFGSATGKDFSEPDLWQIGGDSLFFTVNKSSNGPIYSFGGALWLWILNTYGARTYGVLERARNTVRTPILSNATISTTVYGGQGQAGGISFPGETGTSGEIVGWAYPNNGYAAYTVWAKNPTRENQITAQLVIIDRKGVFVATPVLTPPRWNFYAFDILYGPVATDSGPSGDYDFSFGSQGFLHTHKQLVDSDIGIASSQLFSSLGNPTTYSQCSAVFLTPKRIMVQAAGETYRYEDPPPGSGATTPELFIDPDYYVAVSDDYGRTWVQFHETRGFLADTWWAAVNHRSALRVGMTAIITTVGVYAGNRKWAIDLVDIDGDVTEMLDLSALIINRLIVAAQIEAVGRGVYVVKIRACKDGHDQPEEVYYSHSMDSGNTWSPLTLSIVEYATRGDGKKQNGEKMYVHEAADPLSPTDPFGRIYMAINLTGIPTPSLGVTTLNLGSELWVSRDLGETWAFANTIGQKHEATFSNATFPYETPIDTAVDIDPVFPWTRDERVSPPDWW